MQTNPSNANRVFQDVDPLLSIEGSHSFQGFPGRGPRRGCCSTAASPQTSACPFLRTRADSPPVHPA